MGILTFNVIIKDGLTDTNTNRQTGRQTSTHGQWQLYIFKPEATSTDYFSRPSILPFVRALLSNTHFWIYSFSCRAHCRGRRRRSPRGSSAMPRFIRHFASIQSRNRQDIWKHCKPFKFMCSALLLSKAVQLIFCKKHSKIKARRLENFEFWITSIIVQYSKGF